MEVREYGSNGHFLLNVMYYKKGLDRGKAAKNIGTVLVDLHIPSLPVATYELCLSTVFSVSC